MGWQEERRQLAGNEKESTAPFSKLRWVHGTVSQDTLSLYLCHSICLASSSRFTFLQTTAFWQVPLPVRPFLRNQPGQISQTLCCLIMGNSYTLGSCRTCCADRTHPIPGSITRHPGESLKALVFVSRLPGDERRLNVFLIGVNDLKEPGWLGGKVMESWLCRWVASQNTACPDAYIVGKVCPWCRTSQYLGN